MDMKKQLLAVQGYVELGMYDDAILEMDQFPEEEREGGDGSRGRVQDCSKSGIFFLFASVANEAPALFRCWVFEVTLH
jgi:hypothetical protein